MKEKEIIKRKISELRKLRKLNLELNLFSRKKCGLCKIYRRITYAESLYINISELYKNKNEKTEVRYNYWWYDGRNDFLWWFTRHLAINKTIRQLKKELKCFS